MPPDPNAETPSHDAASGQRDDWTRRRFIVSTTVAGTVVAIAPHFCQNVSAAEAVTATAGMISLKLKINGTEHALEIDPRVTLLDLLREHLDLSGSKKGCDHGQ